MATLKGLDMYKLGKLPHRADPRTLQFKDYVTPEFPAVPSVVDYSHHVPSWPMFGNDTIGDCTCAAAGHMVELWTAMASAKDKPTALALATVERLYHNVTGWPETGDNGAVELDVLNYWRKTGITSSHKIFAFAQLDPHNHNHVMGATFLFGGVYIGFGISDANQLFDEFNHNVPWTPESGQVTEGHAVNIVGYDQNGLTCVSWGRTQRMTWGFWDNQVDEAWAILPDEWERKTGLSGINFAALKDDLSQIGTLK